LDQRPAAKTGIWRRQSRLPESGEPVGRKSCSQTPDGSTAQAIAATIIGCNRPPSFAAVANKPLAGAKKAIDGNLKITYLG
jgi:hypothetical protein